MIQTSHTAGSRDDVKILKRTQGVRRRRSISYLAMPDAHFRRLLDYSIAESVRTYAGLISNTLENCDALSAGPATITATSPIDIRLPGVPIRHIAQRPSLQPAPARLLDHRLERSQELLRALIVQCQATTDAHQLHFDQVQHTAA